MKTLTLDLKEYQDDLILSEIKGKRDAFRSFVKILQLSKEYPKLAITSIVEEFEDDQKSIDQMIEVLNLKKFAEEMFT